MLSFACGADSDSDAAPDFCEDSACLAQRIHSGRPALNTAVLSECLGEQQEQLDHLNPFLFGVVVGSSLFLLAVVLFAVRVHCAPRTAVWDESELDREVPSKKDRVIELSALRKEQLHEMGEYRGVLGRI